MNQASDFSVDDDITDHRPNILPPSAQAAALQSSAKRGGQPAFPPLGTTLSSYSPSSFTGGAVAAPGFAATNSTAASATAVDSEQKPRSWKKLLKRTLIVLVVIGVLTGGYIGAKVLINASKSFRGNLLGLLQNDKLQGEDSGHVNILLAGNSADDPGHGGGQLTDSLMIASLDTTNHTAFLLSIPRDLYVDVPGNGYAKINEVYQDGQQDKFSQSGYPDGGMGLLEKVLETDLGVDINYYALINYTAFRDAVNAVGGIDVTIASPDSRGLYDAMIAKVDGGPLRLANGPQHLDGQTALNLARARGSGYSYGFPLSDFNRTEHQRQMLVALKEKSSSAGVLSNPVKIGNLLDSFGNNVVTDIKTSEVRRMVELGQKVPSASIKSVSLNDANGKNLLQSYRTRLGQSALAPAAGLDDYTAISAFIDTLLTPPAPATPTQTP